MTRWRILNLGPSVMRSFKVNRLPATHTASTLSALPSLRGPEQPHQKALSLSLVAKSCLTLVIPWTVACQAPLSMAFSRQQFWNGLLFPSPGDLPNPGIEPGTPALQADSLPTELHQTAMVPEKQLISQMLFPSLKCLFPAPFLCLL